jgi:hypothetical protein
MAQVVEHPPSNQKDLSSSLTATLKKFSGIYWREIIGAVSNILEIITDSVLPSTHI